MSVTYSLPLYPTGLFNIVSVETGEVVDCTATYPSDVPPSVYVLADHKYFAFPKVSVANSRAAVLLEMLGYDFSAGLAGQASAFDFKERVARAAADEGPLSLWAPYLAGLAQVAIAAEAAGEYVCWGSAYPLGKLERDPSRSANAL